MPPYGSASSHIQRHVTPPSFENNGPKDVPATISFGLPGRKLIVEVCGGRPFASTEPVIASRHAVPKTKRETMTQRIPRTHPAARRKPPWRCSRSLTSRGQFL